MGITSSVRRAIHSARAPVLLSVPPKNSYKTGGILSTTISIALSPGTIAWCVDQACAVVLRNLLDTYYVEVPEPS